jgi:hypothetical protein
VFFAKAEQGQDDKGVGIRLAGIGKLQGPGFPWWDRQGVRKYVQGVWALKTHPGAGIEKSMESLYNTRHGK